MKKHFFFISLLIAASSLRAQTITLSAISKLNYCVGDTLLVPYQANGTFAADNFFFVELSDPNGSFATFTNFGHDAALSGAIPVKLGEIGSHFRVRIIATDSLFSSSDNGSDIQVAAYPSPQPTPLQGAGFYAHKFFVAGVASDTLTFSDAATESIGSSYLWQFNQDAIPNSLTTPFANVSYPTSGNKTFTLTVTNLNGCAATANFAYNVANCDQVIPPNVHVVAGTETGSDSAVLVKAGGTYTSTRSSGDDNIEQTIFVESGASFTIGEGSTGICYALNDASIISNNFDGFMTVILKKGTTITIPSGNEIDTLHCNNMSFDYSQVQASVSDDPQPPNITILQSGDHLFANDEGLPIDIRITNLLGAEMLSQRGSGALDVDLSALPAGVYFAVIQAGNDREIKRIAVVH